MEEVDQSVTAGEKEQLKSLLHEFADVFSKSEFDLGCTDLAVHSDRYRWRTADQAGAEAPAVLPRGDDR